MLKLLLDEHLSPQIAAQFRSKEPRADIESVLFWKGGRFAGSADEVLLTGATDAAWTLVTYDLATIVPLLKTWGEQGIEHSGVILVDDRTIAPNDIGALIEALRNVWATSRNDDWRNVVVYLVRS